MQKELQKPEASSSYQRPENLKYSKHTPFPYDEKTTNECIEYIYKMKQLLKNFIETKINFQAGSSSGKNTIDSYTANEIWDFFSEIFSNDYLYIHTLHDILKNILDRFKFVRDTYQEKSETDLLISIYEVIYQYGILLDCALNQQSEIDSLISNNNKNIGFNVIHIRHIQDSLTNFLLKIMVIIEQEVNPCSNVKKFNEITLQIKQLPFYKLLKTKESLNNFIDKLKNDKPDVFLAQPIDKKRKRCFLACIEVLGDRLVKAEEISNGLLFLLQRTKRQFFHAEYHYYRGKIHEFLRNNNILPININEATHQFLHNEQAELIYSLWENRWSALPEWSEEPTQAVHQEPASCQIL